MISGIPQRELQNQLLIAIARKDADRAIELIPQINDISFRFNRPGISNIELFTPLHLAIDYALPSVARVLIANGADLKARTEGKFKYAPLHYAITKLDTAEKRLDVQHIIGLMVKADPSIRTQPDHFDNTPIHNATKSPVYLPVLKFLLAYHPRINPNIEKPNHTTPLHSAAMSHNFETVKYLIEHGANPRLMTREMKTADQLTYKQHIKDYILSQFQPTLAELCARVINIHNLLPQIEEESLLPDFLRNNILQFGESYATEVQRRAQVIEEYPEVERLDNERIERCRKQSELYAQRYNA